MILSFGFVGDDLNDVLILKESLISEGLSIRPIPEDSSRTIAYQKGEIDFLLYVPLGEVDRLKKDPQSHVDILTGTRTIFMGFNTVKEPTSDIRVRKAIAHSMNRDFVIKAILGDLLQEIRRGSEVTGECPNRASSL